MSDPIIVEHRVRESVGPLPSLACVMARLLRDAPVPAAATVKAEFNGVKIQVEESGVIATSWSGRLHTRKYTGEDSIRDVYLAASSRQGD